MTDQRTREGVAATAAAKATLRRQVAAPFVGFIWVTLAMLFLAGIAGFARYAALAGMDPLVVLFFRNAFCVIWMLPLFAWRGMSLVRTRQLHLYGARVAFSFLSMLTMFHALAMIPIAEVTAIAFLSPIFGTLFAIVLLGENVQSRRWTALLIGFFGAVIILRPGMLEFGAGQALALASAMAIGVIGPLVKRLTVADDADRIVFITNVLMTPLALVPALFVWQWPAPELWLPLAGLGLCAVLGHMSLVRGYAALEASFVMTLKFSRLPFSVIIGYLAFGELIDTMTWIGAAIIVVSAAYITHRETQIKAPRHDLHVPPPL